MDDGTLAAAELAARWGIRVEPAVAARLEAGVRGLLLAADSAIAAVARDEIDAEDAPPAPRA